MNESIKTRLSENQILDRVRKKVIKEYPAAYNIYVGDYKLSRRERYGFINIYVTSKVLFSIEGSSKEFVEDIVFGIE
ncbi:MAG: hypothetical protein ACRCX8_18390 [Sarcina sp.]